MDAFDDQPSSGGGYDREPIVIPIDGRRQIVVRFRGRPAERVSIILEVRRNETSGALIRYDDAHGYFHRHEPGWPTPGPEAERLDHITPAMRARYAIDEIRAQYTVWEAALGLE